MNTSHRTDRSSKRFSISKSAVALAIVFVLVLTSTNARSAETRLDTSPLGSEGEAIYASTSTPNVSPVTLPIEVLGPDGYTVSVNVDVPAPGQVSKLYLQIHSPVYRDISVNPGRGPKASVRLNGGPWIGISNQTVDVFDHEAEFGGLNGTYHTVRMTIPISALGTPQSGSNTLRFRFNGTDDHTLGFRVLDLNFLRSGGSEILPASAFTESDPSLWTPISNNPADINAGEDLWRSAQLVNYPNGPSIQAACGDCHAQDGRDLWYFAYSDRSIVERSKFHGLSQGEAEQIASYIRSLQNSDASYNYIPPGRPWNPPFQPGPGLDLLPAHAWSAGAGLEWVLETDEEMVDYAFPEGITKDAIAPTNKLNMREIPVAIQFPDWNEWLPDVHPLDYWGGTFTNDDSYEAYEYARTTFAANDLEDLVDLNINWPNNPAKMFDNVTFQAQEFYKNRGALNGASGNERDERRRSLVHWSLTKMWELAQEFDLNDVAPDVYGSNGETRGWLGKSISTFAAAPHILADNNVRFANFQDGFVGKFSSTQWYQVSFVTGTGHTVHSKATAPIDYHYVLPHIQDLRDGGGPAHGVRALLTFAKNAQVFNDHAAVLDAAEPPYSLWWRQVHPARYNPTNSRNSRIFEDIPAQTLGRLFEALLGQFMDRIEPYGLNGWDRRDDTDGDGAYCDNMSYPMNERMQDADFNGEPSGNGCASSPLGWGNTSYLTTDNNLAGSQRWYAESWYQMIPVYRSAGVSETTLNRLIDWGEDFFPLGPWDDLRTEGPTSQAPAAGNDAASVLLGGSVVIDILANDYDPDGSLNPGSIVIVTDPARGTATVNFATGAITYTHNGSAASTDALGYTVADNEGNISNEATVAITINQGNTEPTAHDLDLQTGWNTVALTVTPDNPAFTDVFGGTDQLVMVKNASGQVFFPEYGLNQLGAWNVAQAYLVLMGGDALITVQGTPLVPVDTPIALSAGWNLIPFFLGTPQPIEEALASILDHLNYLSDEEGGVFDPVAGVNTIGMLEPGRGYRAYLSEDTVLIYPSDGSRQGEVATRSTGALENTLRPQR